MIDLDRTLFLALNADPASSHAVVLLAILLAKYVIVLVPLHMVIVWTAGDRPMRFVVLSGLIALVMAIAVNQAIGLLVYRPRPFLAGLGHALIEHRDSSSMPSNHATVFFTYAATLALFSRRNLALVTGALGLAVAWSRIYLGIHYPFDMVVAALVSALAALTAVWMMARHGTPLLAYAEQIQSRLMRGAAHAYGRVRGG